VAAPRHSEYSAEHHHGHDHDHEAHHEARLHHGQTGNSRDHNKSAIAKRSIHFINGHLITSKCRAVLVGGDGSLVTGQIGVEGDLGKLNLDHRDVTSHFLPIISTKG